MFIIQDITWGINKRSKFSLCTSTKDLKTDLYKGTDTEKWPHVNFSNACCYHRVWAATVLQKVILFKEPNTAVYLVVLA